MDTEHGCDLEKTSSSAHSLPLPQQSSRQSPGPPPEGGLRAWLALCSGATVMALSFGMVNSFGVYQSYYENKYPHISSNTLSIIGSLQGCLTFATALPSTVGMYYLGPQVMVGAGGLICILSYMFLSITTAPWQIFVVQGLMFGLGSGLMYVHCAGVVFQYFHRRKAIASGLITAGASMAGVYWPIGVRGLINKVGFAWGNRIIGFLYIPMVAFATTNLRPRVRPPPRKPGQNVLRINFRVLLNWRFQVLNISFAVAILGLFPGLFYVDLFCQRLGVAQPIQDYNVAIVNAATLLGRVSCGYIGDKLGRFNIMIPTLVLSGVLPLALWMTARSSAATLAFCITWGFATGPFVSLAPAIVGQLFADELPSYLGVFFPTAAVGVLVGPIIAGTFIPPGHVDNVDGFDKLCIFVGALFLATAASLSVLRFVYQRRLLAKM
ncbi:putative membrane protein [Ogataea parapolymorpha DL-1]|uniref:Membrane protein n=1 Tax=Ogataea parapolymorpha (strain ATCC 26012 / BCRC 20466 / JCM 22074 / NRRL Y-7560 / DL-1) TaxID=871575 RepID=W1QLG3_OGAPD|nr:putative membrane protein [Ogataea parapolymorpha DL-1]ESX02151.1 putative membrane protein [Ogataea parapolymorpha DL-1]